MILRLENDAPPSVDFAHRFQERKVLPRLKALDAKARRRGVAGLDPTRNELIRIGMETAPDGEVKRNCYGLFHLSWLAEKHPEWPRNVLDELDEIRNGIRTAHGANLKSVVWAGAGGTAGDQAMYLACGLLRRGPKTYILDSTDPAKLNSILADMEARAGSLREALKSTLAVGMALGETCQDTMLNIARLATLYDKTRLDSRPNMLCLTHEGTLLAQFADGRHYRRVAPQLEDGNAITGRHAAPLTRCSLYPLGLAGLPLKAWIAGTYLREDEIDGAFRLAAFLHQQGLNGRDKVTLALAPSLAGAAQWTKRSFEQSLGRSEQLGVKMITGEPLRMADYRAPKDARQDRVFLLVGRKGEPAADRLKAALLRRSGYPAASLTLPAEAPLSRYLQFVHYTVFGLAWLREMDFVTQTGAELCASIAQPLYENSIFQGGIENTSEWKQLRGSPRQVRWRGGVALHFDRLPCGFEPAERNAAAAYASLLRQLAEARLAECGELAYFGDTRYHEPGRKVLKLLERAAALVYRDGLKMPADVCEGPSASGTYHEMAIGHGRCISTLLLSEKTEEAGGCRADHHRAQFLAAQMALQQRGRLVVTITLRDLSEASLRALDEFLRQTAAQLKHWR